MPMGDERRAPGHRDGFLHLRCMRTLAWNAACDLEGWYRFILMLVFKTIDANIDQNRDTQRI